MIIIFSPQLIFLVFIPGSTGTVFCIKSIELLILLTMETLPPFFVILYLYPIELWSGVQQVLPARYLDLNFPHIAFPISLVLFPQVKDLFEHLKNKMSFLIFFKTWIYARSDFFDDHPWLRNESILFEILFLRIFEEFFSRNSRFWRNENLGYKTWLKINISFSYGIEIILIFFSRYDFPIQDIRLTNFETYFLLKSLSPKIFFEFNFLKIILSSIVLQ